jgi:hypothetical protein
MRTSASVEVATTTRRLVLVLTVLLGAALVVGSPTHADPVGCSPDDPSRQRAELFATDNTVVITDPADPRLRDRLELFELQANATIVQDGASSAGSTLVDGIFWSDELKATTYERSRDFHLPCIDELQLHTLAHDIRQQFHQESVLTFAYLPQEAPRSDAVTIEAPDADTTRFHDVLAGDPVARQRVVGGSITESHTLILVAGIADLALARRLVVDSGAQVSSVTVQYGHRELVQGQ